MVLAEVRKDNNSPAELRLFACGIKAFRKSADKKFSSVLKVVKLDNELIKNVIARGIGWQK